MNPSQLFVMRPVGTILLMVTIVMAGVLGFAYLPLSALPEVDYPTIQVQTFYPGASPDVMTTAVTAPLEQQFGQMPGLNQMISTGSGDSSVITLQFNLSLNTKVAEQEVQSAINVAKSLLPSNLPSPPIYAKVNSADTSTMTLAVQIVDGLFADECVVLSGFDRLHDGASDKVLPGTAEAAVP